MLETQRDMKNPNQETWGKYNMVFSRLGVLYNWAAIVLLGKETVIKIPHFVFQGFTSAG